MSKELYKEYAAKALAEFIEKLKEAPEDSQIAKANKHLLGGSTWAAGGNLTLGGFIYWAASCELVITDVTGIGAVEFSANGTGFMVGALDSEVVGAFVVDPATVGGSCHFTIVIAAVEEGVATLTLYGTDGKIYGTFAGPAEGLAAGGMSGSGKLVVKHT